LCHMDVEDEFHFLMNCDKLIHERVTLFRNISDIVPSCSRASSHGYIHTYIHTYTSENLNMHKEPPLLR
jgi:hypothetical protein